MVRRKEKEFHMKAQHDVEDSTDMNVTAKAITVKQLLISVHFHFMAWEVFIGS